MQSKNVNQIFKFLILYIFFLELIKCPMWIIGICIRTYSNSKYDESDNCSTNRLQNYYLKIKIGMFSFVYFYTSLEFYCLLPLLYKNMPIINGSML